MIRPPRAPEEAPEEAASPAAALPAEDFRPEAEDTGSKGISFLPLFRWARDAFALTAAPCGSAPLPRHLFL